MIIMVLYLKERENVIPCARTGTIWPPLPVELSLVCVLKKETGRADPEPRSNAKLRDDSADASFAYPPRSGGHSTNHTKHGNNVNTSCRK